MRKIERAALSAASMNFLWERRLRVVAAGDRATRSSEREQAQYAEAHTLWGGSYKANNTFDEIRRVLSEDMAPGHGFCMYCEYNHGSAIEHFRPMQRYPTRAFDWDNYLWSCSICNDPGNKGTKFPLDGNGLPLLINPTRDNPKEHIDFVPRSGKLVGRTPKGEKTIETLGFHLRGELDKTRASAWRSMQHHLVAYDDACVSNDHDRAHAVQHDLCRHPHASLLALLIDVIGMPGANLLVQEPRCAGILAKHPEIRSWV